MRRLAVAIACVTCLGAAAHAEPWYRGKYGKNRVANLSVTAATGVLFVLSETYWKPSLAPDTCRWCDPPWIDRRVRNALVWDDRDNAALASNLTGYVTAPAVAIGLTLYESVEAGDAPLRAQVIDDIVPLVETVTLSQLVIQTLKFSVGRQRPYAHFGTAPPDDIDANVSFASGHSALAFGLATSAGMIAHRRGYKSEPYVWGIGMSLAGATAYLRIAADKHYLTDVLTGSAIGIASGLTVPLLMCRPRADLTVMPTRNGVALAGTF